MKLLAQFYACLAIIVVFTAVFSRIEARSYNHRGLATDQQQLPPKELVESRKLRMRRAFAGKDVENVEEAPKQLDEQQSQGPQRARRNAPQDQEEKKQLDKQQSQGPQRARRNAPQDQEEKKHKGEEEHEPKRHRRQTMPTPEEVAQQFPKPPGSK